MSLSKAAVLEIQNLSSEAEKYSTGTASERKRADILCQRISTIKQVGLSSEEVRRMYSEALIDDIGGSKVTPDAERRNFERYLIGEIEDTEYRDFLAGTSALTYTQGPVGGFTIPFSYDATLRLAMSQTDPILDSNVTDFSMNDGPFCQPEQISGYNLTSCAASIVGESVQQNPQAIPAVLGATLKSYTFRASFAASMESEQDIPDFSNKIVTAAGVAQARGVGANVLIGTGGGTQISGIVPALTSSFTNATSGKLAAADLNSIFFSVNRWHRNQPKCAWLISDGVYKFVRAAVDASGRPLLNVEKDIELLYGKPIYVSPSLATATSGIGTTGALIFGNLASIVIRTSRPTLYRSTEQSQADITKGECMYISRLRADASYFDASSGAVPPIVLATIN